MFLFLVTVTGYFSCRVVAFSQTAAVQTCTLLLLLNSPTASTARATSLQVLVLPRCSRRCSVQHVRGQAAVDGKQVSRKQT